MNCSRVYYSGSGLRLWVHIFLPHQHYNTRSTRHLLAEIEKRKSGTIIPRLSRGYRRGGFVSRVKNLDSIWSYVMSWLWCCWLTTKVPQWCWLNFADFDNCRGVVGCRPRRRDLLLIAFLKPALSTISLPWSPHTTYIFQPTVRFFFWSQYTPQSDSAYVLIHRGIASTWHLRLPNSQITIYFTTLSFPQYFV